MKVAMIVNAFPKVSEKFLVNQIVGLVRAGVDVVVFAAHEVKSEPRHEIYLEYGLDSKTRFMGIPRSMVERFLRAPVLFFGLLAKNPKAAFEALRFGKYRTVAMNLKLLWFGNLFAGLAKDGRFDLVHCQFGVNGLVGAYLKECGFCDTVVTTFHGSDINNYPRKHGKNVYRTLYAKGDLIITNTNFTKSKVVANGCPESRVRIVPVPLVASEYADVGRDSVEPDTVLTVGRLVEKKGHRYALEAIAKAMERRPAICYRIVGNGELLDELRERAERLGIAGRCEFLGVLTGPKLLEAFATSAVFTLPSVTASNGDMEGQGLVLQEAQICGVPVVSTIHNGIPDGLIDGVTGYLVPEKDPDALADRIAYLLENPEIGARMGDSGKKFVSAGYDIEPVTEKILACYAEAGVKKP